MIQYVSVWVSTGWAARTFFCALSHAPEMADAATEVKEAMTEEEKKAEAKRLKNRKRNAKKKRRGSASSR